MGLFMDMLNTGNRKRAAREEYEREHPQSDYSSGTSRPRRIRYTAYCRICGRYISRDFGSPGDAISYLQSEQCLYGGSTKSCGSGNHSFLSVNPVWSVEKETKVRFRSDVIVRSICFNRIN